MLLNFTNHHSSNWSGEQKKEAEKQYGSIEDLAFPEILPEYTDKEVETLATKYMETIEQMNPEAVLCQGEFTFVYQIVCLLKERGIKAVAATSRRCVKEVFDQERNETVKQSCFKFVSFRAY